ncbi:MAG: hypothetical protein KME04_03975 [Pleurocapsa minor GSE-CHR-MK-17-07R]|jgi:hypothetical protein|nr:hypothetical protein [Pleurocapsa minor GSE-CHR-MK 17-07R]
MNLPTHIQPKVRVPQDAQPIVEGAHVMPAEWRWVMMVGGLLVLLASVTVIIAALTVEPGYRFNGVLYNYLDGASYFSKMRLGADGELMVSFLHTPELHEGAFIQTLYPLLGYLSRITALPDVVLFHIMRAFAGLFMYAALYQFGAMIWWRVSTRRIFFLFTAFGGGLGWLLAPLTGISDFPDFALLPEAYPFYSSLMNVHFPMTIGCLALLSVLLLGTVRPESRRDPSLRRAWIPAGGLAAIICLLYPQGLVPLVAALALSIGLTYLRDRRLPLPAVRCLLAILVVAVPYAGYVALAVSQDAILREWNSQNVTAAPPLFVFLAGFAILLLIGLPAMYRALRRMEADGDRLMLLWLVMIVAAVYFPSNIQRRFAVGMVVPLGYFAVRAYADVWMPRFRGQTRKLLTGVAITGMALSPMLLMLVPALGLRAMPEESAGIILESGYEDAFAWMAANGDRNDVVLAAPPVSAWIPAETGLRVVYGHPYETMDAANRLPAVRAWYAAPDSVDCETLLTNNRVRFVVMGPQERLLGEAACTDSLRLEYNAQGVMVYGR